MPNYSNGKVYKLQDDVSGLVYIGSTCRTLKARLKAHEAAYSLFKQERAHYRTAFAVLKGGSYSIHLIEAVDCTDKYQLLEREIFHIKAHECINKTFNLDKYNKDLHEKNTEVIKNSRREEYLRNREHLLIKFECDCGGRYDKIHENKHKKTKRHIQSL